MNNDPLPAGLVRRVHIKCRVASMSADRVDLLMAAAVGGPELKLVRRHNTIPGLAHRLVHVVSLIACAYVNLKNFGFDKVTFQNSDIGSALLYRPSGLREGRIKSRSIAPTSRTQLLTIYPTPRYCA